MPHTDPYLPAKSNHIDDECQTMKFTPAHLLYNTAELEAKLAKAAAPAVTKPVALRAPRRRNLATRKMSADELQELAKRGADMFAEEDTAPADEYDEMNEAPEDVAVLSQADVELLEADAADTDEAEVDAADAADADDDAADAADADVDEDECVAEAADEDAEEAADADASQAVAAKSNESKPRANFGTWLHIAGIIVLFEIFVAMTVYFVAAPLVEEAPATSPVVAQPVVKAAPAPEKVLEAPAYDEADDSYAPLFQ